MTQVILETEWDEIDLSSAARRQEKLEILMCKKIQKGEDIRGCLMALEHYRSLKLQQLLHQKTYIMASFYSFKKRLILSLVITICIIFSFDLTKNTMSSQLTHAGTESTLSRKLGCLDLHN
jgi:hypothetical protein